MYKLNSFSAFSNGQTEEDESGQESQFSAFFTPKPETISVQPTTPISKQEKPPAVNWTEADTPTLAPKQSIIDMQSSVPSDDRGTAIQAHQGAKATEPFINSAFRDEIKPYVEPVAIAGYAVEGAINAPIEIAKSAKYWVQNKLQSEQTSNDPTIIRAEKPTDTRYNNTNQLMQDQLSKGNIDDRQMYNYQNEAQAAEERYLPWYDRSSAKNVMEFASFAAGPAGFGTTRIAKYIGLRNEGVTPEEAATQIGGDIGSYLMFEGVNSLAKMAWKKATIRNEDIHYVEPDVAKQVINTASEPEKAAILSRFPSAEENGITLTKTEYRDWIQPARELFHGEGGAFRAVDEAGNTMAVINRTPAMEVKFEGGVREPAATIQEPSISGMEASQGRAQEPQAQLQELRPPEAQPQPVTREPISTPFGVENTDPTLKARMMEVARAKFGDSVPPPAQQEPVHPVMQKIQVIQEELNKLTKELQTTQVQPPQLQQNVQQNVQQNPEEIVNTFPQSAFINETPIEPKYNQTVLDTIYSEISAGQPLKGGLIRNTEGTVINRVGANSTYPEYFKRKGYTKENTLMVMDKYNSGKSLTPKQTDLIHDLYHSSGYASMQATKDNLIQSIKDAEFTPEELNHWTTETPQAINGLINTLDLTNIVNEKEMRDVIREMAQSKTSVEESPISQESSTEKFTLNPDINQYNAEQQGIAAKQTRAAKQAEDISSIDKKYDRRGDDAQTVSMFGNSVVNEGKNTNLFDQPILQEEPTAKMPQGAFASSGSQKTGKFEKSLPAEKTEDVKIFNEVRAIVGKFAERIGEGYLPKGAKGVYYSKTKNIRISGLNALSTAIHEVAHAVDFKHNISKQLRVVVRETKNGNPMYEQATAPYRKQFTDLYIEHYPTASSNHALEKRVTEGFATLIQKYIEMPNTITNAYPDLVKEFLTPAGRYSTPELVEFIADAQNIVSKYQALSSLDKIGAHVTDVRLGTGKDSFLSFMDKVRTEIADNIFPIEKLAKQAGVHFTASDPSIWMRQYNNYYSLAIHNITGDQGYYGYKDGAFVKKHDQNWKSLIDILHNKNATDSFGFYLVARSSHFEFQELNKMKEELEALNKILDDINDGKSGSIADTESEIRAKRIEIRELKSILDRDPFTEQEVAEAYEQNKSLFKEEEKLFDKLTAEDLDFLNDKDVQLLKNEQYEELSNKIGYASKRREFYDELTGDSLSSNGAARVGKVKVSSMIKRKGSQRAILNPVFSALTNHSEVIKKGLRQIVYNKMGAIAEKFPELFQQQELKVFQDGTGRINYPQEKDEKILMTRKNYKRVPYLVDNLIKRTIDEAMNFGNIGYIEKLLMAGSRLFTKGTTGVYAPFAVSNFFIDQVTATVNSEKKYLPLYDVLHQVAKSIQSKATGISSPEHQYMLEYLVLGGERQTIVGWQDMGPQELFDSVMRERKGLLKVVDYINNGLEIAAIPSKWSEIGTRAIEFVKSRIDGESQMVALERAGRITAPFHHVGRWGGGAGRNLIRSIPFFNPSIQVLDQAFKRINTKNGFRIYSFVALALAAAQLAALGLLQTTGSDKQVEFYKDIDPKELPKYLWLPSTKKDKLIKIRIPELLSFTGTLSTMMVSDVINKTNYGGGEYLDVAASWIPTQFNVLDLGRASLSWIPQILKVPIMAVLNKKDFPRIGDLESQGVQMLPEGERVYENTSYVAKRLGKVLDISPIKIDFVLTGYFGRATRFLTGAKMDLNPLEKKDNFTSGRAMVNFYETKRRNEQMMRKINKGEQLPEKQFNQAIEDYKTVSQVNGYMDYLRMLDLENEDDLKAAQEVRTEIRKILQK